jgi:hypothetical protein
MYRPLKNLQPIKFASVQIRKKIKNKYDDRRRGRKKGMKKMSGRNTAR